MLFLQTTTTGRGTLPRPGERDDPERGNER
jgi:hypothetical protein